jgi:hypothetical protein
MSLESRIAVWLASLLLAPVALGQSQSATSTTESNAVQTATHSGVVETVAGNKVVLREADGLHEYNVPPGFSFQLDGKDVGVADIKPGMGVNATFTDKVTTRQVRVTRIDSGTVAQVTPGGFVLRDKSGYTSYSFKDAAGKDKYFVQDGKEVPLSDVKVGDRLSGTFVETLPPQQISQRTVVAKATEPTPPPAPAPVAVAAATPHRLPKTASPLPTLGLLALAAGGIALSLRAARIIR